MNVTKVNINQNEQISFGSVVKLGDKTCLVVKGTERNRVLLVDVATMHVYATENTLKELRKYPNVIYITDLEVM